MSFRRVLLRQIPKVVNERRHCHNLKILTAVSKHNLKMPDHFLVTKRYIQQKSIKCWQCGIERTNISELFCENCSFIQGPQDTNNYFKIFELDEEFDIDPKQLTQKYRKLQSQLHPDKFTNKSTEEKNISEEFSSLVNKAYNILQTPLKRAVHLLHLKGETIEEGQRVEDPEFLMEIMELNEEVESADSAEKLIKLKHKNATELTQIGARIKAAFDDGQIAEAKNLIMKMKYYNSVSLHISSLMRERGIVE